MIYQPLLRKSTWLKSLGLISRSKFSTSTVTSNVRNTSAATIKERDNIFGFFVNEVTPIDEMNLTVIRLVHERTGAQYLHLDRDDSNNVFSIGFRTTPMDSTGLPHILEHMALCGSNRYPCRDPFFKMLRRSLATFMNAMTAPDYTFYPFSTQNLQDYRNLQSVYLDSVFQPELKEIDFLQEGWRMEHTDPNDKKSPIIFKGVVYNEMKGVFNSNQNIFVVKLLNSLLPSHTYGVISGGDPSEIPKLAYEDLINFHKTHYHPSNARFYSYGNFPLQDNLKFINNYYLFMASKIDTTKTLVPREVRWTTPKKKHILCRPDPMAADANRQNSIAIASLCNDITDVQECYNLYILSQLLLDGPNSAFYKSLVDTNIGTGFGSMTGYESQVKDTIFGVSLQGVQEKDFDKVEKIYDETVVKVIEDGFQKDHIEAVLHRIELQTKHQTSNFGLNLLYNIMPLWNHNGNISESLKINQAIENFRDELKKDTNYLKSLTEKYLLKNTHKLTMTMSPSEQFEQQLNDSENALLESKLKNLTPEKLDWIYECGQLLLADQQKEENLECLPSLEIEDLKKDVDRYDLVDVLVSDIPVQLAVQPTNGVCYYRGVINTQHLSADLKNVLPIFNDVVTKMGTEKYDYRDWDKLTQLKTGGLSFSNHLAENKRDFNKFEEGIVINSYCLEHNAVEMWKLWEELFNRVKLTDLQRFETLVKIGAADVANGIANSGHLYSMSSAASLISPVARHKENLSGMEFVNRMKHVAQMKDLSLVLEQMQQIAEEVLSRTNLRSSLNTTANSMDFIVKDMEKFYGELEDARGQEGQIYTSAEPIATTQRAVHHVLPYAVNYASKVVSTVPYGHADHAPLQVLTKLISSSYLHPEIREKGGAYGGGSMLGADGSFYFYSYRDPNSTRTFDIFDGAWDFLSKYDVTETNLVEAKLQIFQKIDSPVSPGNRGMTRFLHGLSFDDVQNHRERLKAVNAEQLLDVAKRYLSPDAKGVSVGRALIGPRNDELSARSSEHWEVLEQEEQSQAQAI